MDKPKQKRIIEICKDIGCCEICCLRYIGLKNPSAYETPADAILKILDHVSGIQVDKDDLSESPEMCKSEDEIPKKRSKRSAVCVSCIGVLQAELLMESTDAAASTMRRKGYECESFSCALSTPAAVILREKAVVLHVAEHISDYDDGGVTSLKEAWKWSRGAELARALAMRLEGPEAPLTVTLTLHYAHDAQELVAVRALAGATPGRAVTRRSAAAALAGVSAGALRSAGAAVPPAPPAARASLAAMEIERRALLLGGRYVKRARDLPQTPWLLDGRRVLPSSVQDVIFAPLAQLFGFDEAQAERRLKFMSAGREDVDVRCLGDGRPFAVEVTDPRRDPTAEELRRACEEMCRSEAVAVRGLAPVSREKLAELKRGEESKCKTYEALCVKLSHTAEDLAEGGGAVRVTARDLANVVAACGAGAGGAEVEQRTPLRVLHRRPLLARRRRVTALAAAAVPGRPALLALRLRTQAGTYVKEWAHGELGRSAPALAAALGARADILALDVTAVHLDWP